MPHLNKRRLGKLLTIIFLAVAACLAVYSFWIESASIRSVTYRLHVSKERAAGFAGMRIVVIADLHAGAPYIDLAKINRVVELANQARADLILLAGDYVGEDLLGRRHISDEAIAAALKPLRARLGVFAVLGNHDYWANGPRIVSALRKAGIHVLINNSVVVRWGPSFFNLVGIDDYITGHSNPMMALSRADRSVALCLTHSPDVFPELPQKCALTIAGHTHGGQVNLPFVGRLIVPSQFGQRYAAGLKFEEGKYLFVSTGIGTSIIPIRFAVPPEVSILDVR